MTDKDLLFELLRFKSITPKDDGALNFIALEMDEFEAHFIEKEGVKNLLLTRKFKDTGAHLAFAGHIDVVPPGDGWESEPFKPLENGGFIYARGAADMKSGLAAFIDACKNANFQGSRLSLIITSDEEGEAKFGTREVLEFMRERSLMPDFAVVAEPSCELKFGDTIKIARRGSINAKLVIKGIAGHVAYPDKCDNPVHNFAPRLIKLANHDLDDGDALFAPSKIVITDIRGGQQLTNVTPEALCVSFNVRNSPKTTLEMVENYVRKLCEGLDFELEIKQSAEPFLTNANSKIAQKLQESVWQITHTKAEFNAAGGTSDARFFAQNGVEVVEFGVRNESIHAPNERVSVEDFKALCAVFRHLVESF